MELYLLLGVVVLAIVIVVRSKRAKLKEEQEFEKIKLEREHKLEREAWELTERNNEAHKKELERQERAKQLEIEVNKLIVKKMEAEKRAADAFESILFNLALASIEMSEEKCSRNPAYYVECREITKSTPLRELKDFVAIDTETTGLKAEGNEIIQLSAVKFIGFEPIERFSTYIKPNKPIPKEATEINHITDEMVADAPSFYQIINSFESFIGNLPVVAHNAPFDVKHLYANGMTSIEDKIVYDTLTLSKKVIKNAESYKLRDVCAELCIVFKDAHNSDYDSLAVGMLYSRLVAKLRNLTIEELIEIVC